MIQSLSKAYPSSSVISVEPEYYPATSDIGTIDLTDPESFTVVLEPEPMYYMEPDVYDDVAAIAELENKV